MALRGPCLKLAASRAPGAALACTALRSGVPLRRAAAAAFGPLPLLSSSRGHERALLSSWSGAVRGTGRCEASAPPPGDRGPASSDGAGPSEVERPATNAERLKKLFQLYGPLAVATHISIGLVNLGAMYALVSVGVDVPALLQKLGLSGNWSTGSTFVVAYAAHKATGPLRIALTLAIVPPLGKYIDRLRKGKREGGETPPGPAAPPGDQSR
eukprot:tig00020592_g11642.t1